MIEMLSDYIASHLTGFWAVVIIALLSCVEISKVKINPISSILGFIGKKCNADLYFQMEKLKVEQELLNKSFQDTQDTMRKRFENIDILMDKKFDTLDSNQDTREAKRLRATLISFADSCRLGVKHTKVQFENVFRDYDDYMMLCEKRKIKNNYINEEMDYVHSIYQNCLQTNSFL